MIPESDRTLESHRLGALTVGRMPPALSISWDWPRDEADSGFLVFMADGDPGVTETEVTCLHCLVEVGGEQLGRGLDLARQLRCSVDYDPDRDDWYVPADTVLAAGELVGS